MGFVGPLAASWRPGKALQIWVTRVPLLDRCFVAWGAADPGPASYEGTSVGPVLEEVRKQTGEGFKVTRVPLLDRCRKPTTGWR